MLRENHQSALAKMLLDSLEHDEFVLLDVGASGGISAVWNQFGDRLRAHGFDPLVAEVDRLNAADTSGRVRYHAAVVNCRDQQVLDGLRTDGRLQPGSFRRTSAQRAMRAVKLDYVKERYNHDEAVHKTDHRITLDEFCAEMGLTRVDFIKIDTDGHDYYVLHGAHDVLSRRGVLGVQVECQLHGASHPHANTFANIDRFMRDRGFALFDLNVWRYTRASLPGCFYYDLPATTVNGQVTWCDALYMLDPVTRPNLHDLKATQIVKLLMLYDIFGLPDCAAELIEFMRDRKMDIPGLHSATELLDLLAPNGDHAGYVADFDRDPTSFFPSRRREAAEAATNQPDLRGKAPSLQAILNHIFGRGAG